MSSDLEAMLATLEPIERAGEFVFVVVDDLAALGATTVLATVVEDEGVTAVLQRDDADALGLPYDFVAAWITLGVHSALEAVGLTAAFSTALAAEGISCNVLAGVHHDHLLVPSDRRADAVAVLRALAV